MICLITILGINHSFHLIKLIMVHNLIIVQNFYYEFDEIIKNQIYRQKSLNYGYRPD